MSAPAATLADAGPLIKPPQWADYTVIAALKCALGGQLDINHSSQDDAKYAILKCLNWYEAHEEYEWPDFSRTRYDFAQVMRLRRELVKDVQNALKRAGSVKISVPGTLESLAGGRQARRSDGVGCTQTNSRKRVCKREAEIDEDAVSDHSEGQREHTTSPRNTSPSTIQKPHVGPTPAPRAAWDFSSGSNAADHHERERERDWSKTHTID